MFRKDDFKTNTGKRIIIKPVDGWQEVVDIFVDGLGFIGRINKQDLKWAIERLKEDEYSCIYRW